jgi:hypothetical protein
MSAWSQYETLWTVQRGWQPSRIASWMRMEGSHTQVRLI